MNTSKVQRTTAWTVIGVTVLLATLLAALWLLYGHLARPKVVEGWAMPDHTGTAI